MQLIGSGNQGSVYLLSDYNPPLALKVFEIIDPRDPSIMVLPPYIQKRHSVINQYARISNEVRIQMLAADLGVAPEIYAYRTIGFDKDKRPKQRPKQSAEIIMEYINGVPISNYLDDEYIMNKFYDKLDLLHEEGIVHNDLIMDNVLVTPEGEVYIIDYGLSHDNATQEEIDNDILL